MSEHRTAAEQIAGVMLSEPQRRWLVDDLVSASGLSLSSVRTALTRWADWFERAPAGGKNAGRPLKVYWLSVAGRAVATPVADRPPRPEPPAIEREDWHEERAQLYALVEKLARKIGEAMDEFFVELRALKRRHKPEQRNERAA